jgi:hypothetical protein
MILLLLLEVLLLLLLLCCSLVDMFAVLLAKIIILDIFKKYVLFITQFFNFLKSSINKQLKLLLVINDIKAIIKERILWTSVPFCYVKPHTHIRSTINHHLA